jgi:hypothetical protein
MMLKWQKKSPSLMRDDISGEPGVTTHRIVVDDRAVKIDLIQASYDKLMKVLALIREWPWARPVEQ